MFSAVGVVFKGSGFYATDSRSKGKANAAKPAEAKSEPAKSESKPAEKAASTTTSSTAA